MNLALCARETGFRGLTGSPTASLADAQFSLDATLPL
jgi:hypothetical protein